MCNVEFGCALGLQNYSCWEDRKVKLHNTCCVCYALTGRRDTQPALTYPEYVRYEIIVGRRLNVSGGTFSRRLVLILIVSSLNVILFKVSKRKILKG